MKCRERPRFPQDDEGGERDSSSATGPTNKVDGAPSGQPIRVVWYAEVSDAAINRCGDYVTIRQASPRTALWAATGYLVLKNTLPATGTRFNPRYVLFGREADVKPAPPPPH